MLPYKTPSGKLSEKLWDDRDRRKPKSLQDCFDGKYRVTEFWNNLEIMETRVEIKKSSYQKNNYSGINGDYRR